MRIAALLMGFIMFPAHAELYRWVDPQSGSVKYTNYPPPWFGDPEREHRYPAVEVIRYQPQPPVAASAAKPAAEKAGSGALAALEARFASLLQFFQSMPKAQDFDRTGAAFQQQAEMYKAVSAELDRIDPSGAARRRAAAQEVGLFEQLRQGIEAQFSSKPPAQ
jgi:hypothetical protein